MTRKPLRNLLKIVMKIALALSVLRRYNCGMEWRYNCGMEQRYNCGEVFVGSL